MGDVTATLAADLARLLARELDAFAREVELFPDDAALWRTVPGVTNAAGTLALHACGNLQHFVGAVLGGTGYVRDREREFGARGLSRADLVTQLAEAREVVRTTLAALGDAALAAPYPQPPGGVRVSTQRFLLHLLVHLGFHLGQAGYLRRALTGDATTSGAVAVAQLA